MFLEYSISCESSPERIVNVYDAMPFVKGDRCRIDVRLISALAILLCQVEIRDLE